MTSLTSKVAGATNDGKSDSSSNVWVKSDFLFESVVCDLHLMALSVGGFATLLGARAASDGNWSFKGWRSVLVDDSQSMRLTLRFHTDIGMTPATAARVAGFYGKIAEAKSDSAELARFLGREGVFDKPALTRAAEKWRRLCSEATAALEAIAAQTRQRLPAPYGEDSRDLLAFLADAAKGDISRVDRFGVISIPRLRQRRSSPRAAVRQTCVVLLPGGRTPAEIEDASRNGLGLICRGPLREGQEIVIEVAGGRRLVGVVARRNGEQAGVRLSSPLPADDPLFGRIAG